DMVDAEVLAALAHHHDAGNEIVDMTEAAGFLPAALDLERHCAHRVLRDCRFHAQRELRHHVLPAHVWPVNIMRPENKYALEMFAAVVDRHHLADDLAGAIGEARAQRIGNYEWRTRIGRDARRCLIDLGARGDNERPDAVLAAG